jgi:hypothetical protein|tara:strand:- start:752 stop:3328 length:2577 start_codon:yes stop_codon:yes gene_type:complete
MARRVSSSYKHFSVEPALGGKLLTDLSEETPDLSNYIVKDGWRRISTDREATREGDWVFQPNQDIPVDTQPYPPITDGNPVTLVHDAIFPNGRTVTIVGTPTQIFAFTNVEGAYVYQVGPDIKSIDLTDDEFIIEGDWTGEFVAAVKFYVDRSLYNDGEYTVVSSTFLSGQTFVKVAEQIPSSVPDGIMIDPTYGNIIKDVNNAGGDWFIVPGDHSATYIEGNIFDVIGSPLNNGRYTVDSDATYDIGNDETKIIVSSPIPDATAKGWLLTVYQTETSWIQIAEVEEGHRWEVFNIDNYVVFNNGRELPFTWQSGHASVTPIYELREQGIGAVETITEFNGMLLCGDLLEIPAADLVGILTGPAPFGVYADEVNGDRRRFRLLWSGIGEPRRFGVSAKGSITTGTDTLTLDDYKPYEWEIGTEIIIAQAGVAFGNLTATITDIAGLIITLDDDASETAVSEDIFQASDTELTPIPGGFQELQDDASGIIRMVELRGRLVVFKATTIMVLTYSGDSEAPFNPTIVHRGSNLWWRWTLSKPKDKDILIFAGEYDFFQFSIASQKPKPVPALSFARDLFFENVDAEVKEKVYACDNEATQEIWFNFPYNALAFDYKFNTVSTVGRYYSGAKTITRPRELVTQRSEERWFVGGREDGEVLTYGLTNIQQPALADGKTVYGLGAKYSQDSTVYQMGTTVHASGFFFSAPDVGRTIVWPTGEHAVITSLVSALEVKVDRSQDVPAANIFMYEYLYSATISSGWGNFGDRFNEKILSAYVLELGSGSDIPEVRVQIYTTRNTNEPAELEVDEILDNVGEDNMIPLFIRGIYVKDVITITNQIKPATLTARTWEASKTTSGSISRA